MQTMRRGANQPEIDKSLEDIDWDNVVRSGNLSFHDMIYPLSVSPRSRSSLAGPCPAQG